MINRINFIEKEPFSFTYQRMGMAAALLAALLVSLLAVQVVREVLLTRKTAQLTQEVTELKMERERRLKEAVIEGGGGQNVRAVLARLLDQALNWPALFKELTVEAPEALWLTAVKMQFQAAPPAAAPASPAPPPAAAQKPEGPKPASIEPRKMTLTGFSGEAIEVTRFVQSLGASPFFEGVVLKELRQEKGGNGFIYSFTIEMAVSATRKGEGSV